jgi:hypothetical protein
MTNTPAPVSAEAPKPGIVERLREWAECGPNVLLEGASADLEVAADTITALRAEVEKWKQLDREAATYVESVICLKSNRFTGNPPYVGWKGLGLALKEDYDELSRLRAENERLRAALEDIKWRSVDRDNMEFEARITCFQMDNIRAALKEPRT